MSFILKYAKNAFYTHNILQNEDAVKVLSAFDESLKNY